MTAFRRPLGPRESRRSWISSDPSLNVLAAFQPSTCLVADLFSECWTPLWFKLKLLETFNLKLSTWNRPLLLFLKNSSRFSSCCSSYYFSRSSFSSAPGHRCSIGKCTQSMPDVHLLSSPQWSPYEPRKTLEVNWEFQNLNFKLTPLKFKAWIDSLKLKTLNWILIWELQIENLELNFDFQLPNWESGIESFDLKISKLRASG